MVNPTQENINKTGYAAFFQGIAGQFSKLGSLLHHIDHLAQLIFAAAKKVQDFFTSFFVSKTPPENAQKVDEVARETLNVHINETKPPVVVASELQTPVVPEPQQPPAVVTPQPKPPVVVILPEPDVVIEDEVVERASPPPAPPRAPTPFEEARVKLDPFVKVNIHSPVLPIKVSEMEMAGTPEVSPQANEKVTHLQNLIQRNFPLFGMSFYPHLKEIEGKTFLAKLGEDPYLIEAKQLETSEKTRMEIRGDHLALFVQKRALIFYPLQK